MFYFASLISFVVLTFVMRALSSKLRLIDVPNHRKVHKGKVPLIGGIIIYLNILLFSLFYQTGFQFNIVIFTSFLIIIFGAIDDAIELGVIFRLIAQLICCLIIIGSGIFVYNIGSYFSFGEINLGIWSIIFTVFCVMGLTNSFNFIDGIDGLCSALSLISILSILIFAYLLNTYIFVSEFKFILLICFIIFIFILFNLSSYFKIFLGDAGSMFLGFFVSWLLILLSQDSEKIIPAALTLWCVTIPVFDMTSVIFRRIIKFKNPFRPDKTHIHHLLIDYELNKYFSLSVISLLAIVLNFFGFMVYYTFGSETSLITFVILLIFYISITYKISKVS